MSFIHKKKYNKIIVCWLEPLSVMIGLKAVWMQSSRCMCDTCAGSCFCRVCRRFSFLESWSRGGFHRPSWRLPEYWGESWECVDTAGFVLPIEHYCHFHTRSNEAQERHLFIVLDAHHYSQIVIQTPCLDKKHSEINCAAPSITSGFEWVGGHVYRRWVLPHHHDLILAYVQLLLASFHLLALLHAWDGQYAKICSVSSFQPHQSPSSIYYSQDPSWWRGYHKLP